MRNESKAGLKDEKSTDRTTAADAKASRTDRKRDRALNESDDQTSDGPHILDRSFSGTYSKE